MLRPCLPHRSSRTAPPHSGAISKDPTARKRAANVHRVTGTCMYGSREKAKQQQYRKNLDYIIIDDGWRLRALINNNKPYIY
jgi:hypothetical protein